MSVVLSSVTSNSSTNFTQNPTISNPELTSTNTTFLTTTAQVKTDIPTPNTATELVTNIDQTITGTLNMLGQTNVGVINVAGVMNVGIPSNIISIGPSTLSNININAITQWSANFKRFCVTNNVTTGGTPAGFKTGKQIRVGIADTSFVTTLTVAIASGIFTTAPTVILTPIPRTTVPNVVLGYGWYYVSAVTATSFTVNTQFSGRRYFYLLMGS